MNIVAENIQLGSGKLTVMVKDSIDIQGVKTISGSRALEDTAPAARNAEVVEHILNADCKITAKTNLHELAFGITGINHAYGTPVNPKYPELIPGGSSSGSAAVVASGEVDFALGTDTGGSVRMPAACCGILGLKPGYGVLSRQGVLPAESSLDCVGIFARDADVLRQVLRRLNVPVDAPLTALPEMAFVAAAQPEIDARILVTLAQRDIYPQPAELPLLSEAHRAGLTLINHENWLAFGPLLASGKVSDDVASRIRRGETVSAQDVQEAETVRQRFSAQMDEQLMKTPLLALATLPELPPTLAEAHDPLRVVELTRLVRPFNLSGHPALTLPMGSLNDRPVALQLVARKGDEGLLVQAAEWLMRRRV